MSVPGMLGAQRLGAADAVPLGPLARTCWEGSGTCRGMGKTTQVQSDVQQASQLADADQESPGRTRTGAKPDQTCNTV
jgi:hypothetical protein